VASGRIERRLSAVLAADVADYSRLMEEFEIKIAILRICQEFLSYIIGALMLVVLIHGCVQFYDPAFRECASGYFCKCKQFHTADEYRAFRVCQAAVLIGWPIGVGVVIILQRNRWHYRGNYW